MKILSIIKKDLKMVFSDKKALAIIIVMPLILMVILSFALKGIFINNDMQMNEINIAVVKQYNAESDNRNFQDVLQNGLLVQQMGTEALGDIDDTSDDVDPENLFFHEFLESNEISDMIAYRIETEERARELLNNGEVSAVVLLPEKYIYDMKINLITPFRNEVEVRVITDPDSSLNGQIVQSIIKSYSDNLSSIMIGKNVLIESSLANNIGNDGFAGMNVIMDGIMTGLESARVDMNFVTLEGRKTISSADYYAVAMLTMFILFAAGHGGRMLLEEKENTTYQRMMVAGTSKLGILSGKLLTVFLIALVQITVMISFSHFALKVEWGDWPSVVIISITAAFAVAGLGSTVAAATYRAGNYKMSNIFESAIIQTMALLGGSYIPIDVMPEVIQKLSLVSLNGIALKAYQKTMMGFGMDAVVGYIGILAGIGAVFALLAVVILLAKGGSADGKHYKTETVKA